MRPGRLQAEGITGKRERQGIDLDKGGRFTFRSSKTEKAMASQVSKTHREQAKIDFVVPPREKEI